jgi:hypothetical protein
MVRLYLPDSTQFEGLDQFLLSGVVELAESKDEADFALDIQDGFYLTCTLEEFASFLEWALTRDEFDAIFLSDFYINTAIHRVESQGHPNLVVKPPVFKSRKVTRSVNKQQIVVHDKGSVSTEIKTTALIFAILIFSGIVLYVVYSKRKRTSSR